MNFKNQKLEVLMELCKNMVRIMNSEIKQHKIAILINSILGAEYNIKKSIVINYIAKLYLDKEIDFKLSGIRLAQTSIP